ncbi:hypothetical protein [Rhizobium sp. 768_B6_N1_8]|uniref:hypothetical protein n=1 Tax=unclassified Rhizobium TaxID=2613769 RepID=UPI003F231FF5
MDIEAFLAANAARRAANGLHVRVTFLDNVREPFNYYAKDVAQRDAYLSRANAAIGKPDPTGLGHVVASVEIVEI